MFKSGKIFRLPPNYSFNIIPKMPFPSPSTMALICLFTLIKLNFPSVRCAPKPNEVAKAFGDLLERFEQNSKHNCFEKGDKKEFKKQKEAIKESLKELSKNGTIGKGQLYQLLNQFNHMADSILESAKGTVEAMEPYSNMVKLDGNNSPVKYYELIYEAERKKISKCFSEAKSDDSLQKILREANTELFEQVYEKFIGFAALTFLLNELANNRNEFKKKFVLSKEDEGIYHQKKSYEQMLSDNQQKIDRLALTQRKIEDASDCSKLCCYPYCTGEMKKCCLIPLCCAEDFIKIEREDAVFDRPCRRTCGAAAILCWCPTFGLLAAPFFGIAKCGTECQKGKLEKRSEKLEGLIKAEGKTLSGRSGKED